MPFTLHPNRWYGWQMIPGYVGTLCVPFCCPCLIRDVTPLKSGKSRLRVAAWVTGYAEGVQEMEKELRVLQRGANHLVAQEEGMEKGDERCIVLSEIEPAWVEKFCPQLWTALKLPVRDMFEPGSIQRRLEKFFSHRDAWRPDLVRDEVIFCALRFDGGKLDAELERENPTGGAYGNFAKRHDEHFAREPWHLHADPLVTWGEFFWLQRSHKWSGFDRESSRLMAWLFIKLHSEPVPEGYEDAEYVRQYEAVRADAMKLAEEWEAHFA